MVALQRQEGRKVEMSISTDNEQDRLAESCGILTNKILRIWLMNFQTRLKNTCILLIALWLRGDNYYIMIIILLQSISIDHRKGSLLLLYFVWKKLLGIQPKSAAPNNQTIPNHCTLIARNSSRDLKNSFLPSWKCTANNSLNQSSRQSRHSAKKYRI